MANNLKEYFREGMGKYLKTIKDNTYTRTVIDAFKATKWQLDNYATPATGGDIAASDNVQVAIGKLDRAILDKDIGNLTDVAENTILGRNDSGTGDSEQLTPSEVRTMINVEDGANNYVHPDADGSKHVPMNGTTNTGKVLTASGTAGVYTWETPTDGITDISISQTADDVTVESSTGNNGVIPTATTSNAGVLSASDKAKLNGIATGAEENVQVDWNQTDTNGDDFIKNKPDVADYQTRSEKGQANGYAGLDSNGKVPVNQLPDTVTGGMEFIGSWDADINSPDLPNIVADKGDYYIVTVTGSTELSGITDWVANDWAVYDGTNWQKVDNTQATQIIHGVDIQGGFDDITQTDANNDWSNA